MWQKRSEGSISCEVIELLDGPTMSSGFPLSRGDVRWDGFSEQCASPRVRDVTPHAETTSPALGSGGGNQP